MYLIYDKETGIVDRALYGSSEPVDANVGPGEAFIAVHEPVIARLPDYSYIHNGAWVHAAPAPSPYHKWDWPTKAWRPDIDDAKAAKKSEVDAERNRRLYLPVALAAGRFDADPVSRERITGMIGRLQRGDGLPAGWLGWRDADNAMHWQAPDPAAVLEQLSGLARAIEDREQAVLVASWQHKANIAALTDIDAIIGYDVTAGWPD